MAPRRRRPAPRRRQPGPRRKHSVRPSFSSSSSISSSSRPAIRVGDPVPESERNRDILRETKLLHDESGEESGFTPMLDLNLGMEFQFSRFASLDFGLRTSRWFGAGAFRSMANDVIADRSIDVRKGDFILDGYYVRLTITPR